MVLLPCPMWPWSSWRFPEMVCFVDDIEPGAWIDLDGDVPVDVAAQRLQWLTTLAALHKAFEGELLTARLSVCAGHLEEGSFLICPWDGCRTTRTVVATQCACIVARSTSTQRQRDGHAWQSRTHAQHHWLLLIPLDRVMSKSPAVRIIGAPCFLDHLLLSHGFLEVSRRKSPTPTKFVADSRRYPANIEYFVAFLLDPWKMPSIPWKQRSNNYAARVIFRSGQATTVAHAEWVKSILPLGYGLTDLLLGALVIDARLGALLPALEGTGRDSMWRALAEIILLLQWWAERGG